MKPEEKQKKQEEITAENKLEKTNAPEKPKKPEKQKKPKKKRNRKRLKYGSIAAAITVIFIAAVVLVNIIVNAFSNQYSLKFDLTSAKLYEVSDETADYLKSIDKDVEIACTYKEKDMQTSDNMKIVYEMLQKYKQNSSKIKLTFFDTTEDPDILQKYQANYSGALKAGDIIISSGSQIRVVAMGDMFDIDQNMLQYYYYGQVSYSDCITGFSGEQKLTSAVMYVTDADPKKAALINMSNGSEIYNADAYSSTVQTIEELFENNGYDVQTADILTDKDTLIPEEYDIIILPAPQNDLTDDSISILQNFLYNGGDYNRQILYFADMTQSETPNIDAFLDTWGIEVTHNIVWETDISHSQQVAYGDGVYNVPLANISDDTYSAGITNTSLPIVAPFARAINLKWDANNELTTASILKTSSTCFEEPPQTEEGGEFDADSAEKGEKTIMAACTKSTTIGQEINTSTLFVVSSMTFLSSGIAKSASYNNAEIVMNSMNTASGKGDGLVIASKDLSAKSITISAGQASLVRNIVVIFIPVIVIIIGIVVFIRRRAK